MDEQLGKPGPEVVEAVRLDSLKLGGFARRQYQAEMAW